MLKNPYYVYGEEGPQLPAHLNFSTFILDKLWQFKDKVAWINGATHESLTYGKIVQHSINFAVSLARIGVGKGHTVAIFSENRQEYWSAVIGVISTGAVITTVSTGYVKGELIHAMQISKPSYIICAPSTYKTHKETLHTIKSIQKVIVFDDDIQTNSNILSYNSLAVNVVNVDYGNFEPVGVDGQSDTLFVLYSSGTTGLPKGVMLTHLNVITSCCLPLSHDPTLNTLTISPWYHTMGLVGSFVGLTSGRTGVYLPKFDVDLYLRTVERYQVAQLTVVPPILVAICKSSGQYDLSSVKIVYSGAAPLHKETLKAVYEKFPNVKAVMQGYGASECTLAVLQFRYVDAEVAVTKPGSVGRVTMGSTVKVVDTETRKPLGPNQHGEICVRGPTLMKGYVEIGRGDDFDDEGLKELIKYKGFQVPPAELEALLLSHPSVNDVGVIGIPHKVGGEVPLAFVVPKEHVTEEELKEFVAQRLSNPKHLRGGVRFIKQVPKSTSGKILRKELRKMAKLEKSKL